LEGVAAVAVDEVALHFVDDGELEGDVGGVGEDGEDGDDEAEVEAARGSGLRGRGVWHRKKDITRGSGRERRRKNFGEGLKWSLGKRPPGSIIRDG